MNTGTLPSPVSSADGVLNSNSYVCITSACSTEAEFAEPDDTDKATDRQSFKDNESLGIKVLIVTANPSCIKEDEKEDIT